MNSDFYNWSDIRVFSAVLKTGSTLAASKQLGMSQPTVARRIDALEHELKLTLFERDTRGFQPTKCAEKLSLLALEIEEKNEHFAVQVEKCRHTELTPIRITAPRVNFSANFAAILSDFSAANPGIDFELISSSEVLDLAAGDADVAVRIASKILDDRLICTKLTTVTTSLYASQSYAAQHGIPASIDDLEGHRFVLFGSERAPFHISASSISLNNLLRDRIKPSQIASQCSDIEGVLTAVKAGFGLGPVPTSLANDDGTLVRCFEPPTGTESSSWLLISPEAYRRPEVKAFATFFAPRFRAIFKPKL